MPVSACPPGTENSIWKRSSSPGSEIYQPDCSGIIGSTISVSGSGSSGWRSSPRYRSPAISAGRLLGLGHLETQGPKDPIDEQPAENGQAKIPGMPQRGVEDA